MNRISASGKWVTAIFSAVAAVAMLSYTFLYTGCSGPEMSTSENAYVGSASCRSCHAEAFAGWEDSHHAHAIEKASDSTVLGDFEDINFSSPERSAFFYRNTDGYYVRTAGIDGSGQEFRIEYTFGYFPLQQYLVRLPGGRLQALDVAWDSRENKWFYLRPGEDIEPGNWLHWTGGGMNWNTMCADCHSTDLRKNYQADTDSFHTTWSVLNVGCEACHGKGKLHVEWAQKYNGKGKMPGYAMLRQTAADTSVMQVKYCAPCHSRRSRIWPTDSVEGDFLNYYIPELLTPGIYHADGQVDGENYVYGSFIQSKMYHNGVKCSSCHNPHSLQLKVTGNDLCGQCHEPKKYNVEAHHFHPVSSDGAQCINCHMPGKYYMVNDFRRDHSFRVPRPDLTAKYGVPNSCNGCHTDRSPEWAAEAIASRFGPERKFHFSDVLASAAAGRETDPARLIRLLEDENQPAIARASAIQYLLQFPDGSARQARKKAAQANESLVRVTALNSFISDRWQERQEVAMPLLKDSVRAVRMSAANLLVDVNISQQDEELQKLYDKAIAEYRAYLRYHSDEPGGQFALAVHKERSREFSEAEIAYLRSLDMDSLFNRSRMNLGLLYNNTGKPEDSRKMFRQVIATEPEYSLPYYYLGLMEGNNGNYTVAIEYMRQAYEREPANIRYIYNLGVLLHKAARYKEAERVYLEGLQLDPDSRELNNAITNCYFQLHQWDDAERHALKLISLFPKDDEFEDWLGKIRHMREVEEKKK